MTWRSPLDIKELERGPECSSLSMSSGVMPGTNLKEAS